MRATCSYRNEEIELREADKYILHVDQNILYWHFDESVSSTYYFRKSDEGSYLIDGEKHERVLTNNHDGEKGLIWFYEYVRSEWYLNKFGDKHLKTKKVKVAQPVIKKIEFEQLELW